MTNAQIQFDIHRLRNDVLAGARPLRITTHAQTEAFKDGLLRCAERFYSTAYPSRSSTPVKERKFNNLNKCRSLRSLRLTMQFHILFNRQP